MMIWSFLAPFQIGDCHRHYPGDAGFNRLFTNACAPPRERNLSECREELARILENTEERSK
jgi:hypothetical protein